MRIDYRDKFLGTIFGVAIGDTLGHPFEGWLRETIYSNFTNFGDFIKDKRKWFTTYTDDTQLTLKTAEALIQGGHFNYDYFINEYVKWLDEPPIGPGYGCLTSIRKLKYGIPWEQAASNSGGNGTVMRISPIGLFFHDEEEELISAALKSSKITHSHPAASAGAIVVAKAISFLMDESSKESFSIEAFFESIISSISNSDNVIWNEFIETLQKVKESLEMPIESGLIKFSQVGVSAPYFIEEYMGKAFVHPYALSTVACAIFIFLKRLGSFEECIYELATAGGDSDTVGAIGGSLAGAYFGFSNIPKFLIQLVKNQKKIMKVSEALYNRYREVSGRF